MKIYKVTNSSWISALAYDAKKRELTIKTLQGKEYTYEKVAPKTFTTLINECSIGSAVSNFLLGR